MGLLCLNVGSGCIYQQADVYVGVDSSGVVSSNVVTVADSGYSGDGVSFVLFASGTNDLKNLYYLVFATPPGERRVWRDAAIRLPNGDMQNMIGSRMVFEWIDGSVTLHKVDFTESDLDDYVAKNHSTGYSYDGLEEFIRNKNGHPLANPP